MFVNMFSKVSASFATDSSGPFVCPNCGRGYKHQRNLTSHINLDCGKEAAFPCVFCPFRAKRRNKLKLHLAMKHPTSSNQSTIDLLHHRL